MTDPTVSPEELAELEALAEGDRVLAAAGFSLLDAVRVKECLLEEDFSWLQEPGW